jgi:hypothetical protein
MCIKHGIFYFPSTVFFFSKHASLRSIAGVHAKCPLLQKMEGVDNFLVKSSNIKFYEHQFNGPEFIHSYRRMDRTSLIGVP